MVVSRVQSIKTLGILGGVGSVFSPVCNLVWFAIYLGPLLMHPTVFQLILVTFAFAMTGGIIGCGLGIRALASLKALPDRARRELKIAGIFVIIISFLSLLNIWVFLSGFALLLAGIEVDTLWKNIQQARVETGFPLTTVATAMGSSWHRRLSCRYCGAPLVTLSAFARGPNVQVRSICPLDKTKEAIRLPLARLEEWAPVLADRFHRCEVCGERTAGQIRTGQGGFATRLRSYCLSNHRNSHFRYIWTPLFPHIARSPPEDVGFRQRQIYPQFVSHVQGPRAQPARRRRANGNTRIIPIPPSSPYPIRIRTRPTRTSNTEAPIYCSMCGVRITAGDRFCFRCGSMI